MNQDESIEMVDARPATRAGNDHGYHIWISFRSPFRLDPRGWEPHFVATERRPQGALLTSWQNPTFTEEGFCYKMAVQADP